MRRDQPLRKIVQWALAPMLVLAMVASHLQPLRAQEPQGDLKSLLVVSLSGYDEILSDVAFLGELAGKPELDKAVDGMLAFFTQGQGLKGLDKTRPWGVVVRTDGVQFQPLAFVPTTDLKQLLDVLTVLGVEAEEQGEGTYRLSANTPTGPQMLFLRATDRWAFVAQTPDALAQLPADPLPLLDGLDKQYDIAVRLHLQNIPEFFRDLAINQLRAGIEQGLSSQSGSSAEEMELQRRLAENQRKQIERLFKETDHVTVGWLVDAEKQSTHLDFSMVALDGTPLARQVAQYQDTTSAFTGFLAEDVAARFNFSNTYPQEEAEQAAVMLDAAKQRAMRAIDEDDDLPDDQARQVLKDALNELIEVAKATVAGGKVDGGGLVRLAPDAVTLAVGAHVVDAPRLEKAIRKIVELAKQDPSFPEVRWNAEEHAGIRFHTARVPVPADEEEARKILGEEMEVVLGVGETSFYVALGHKGIDTIKSVIDQSKAGADRVVAPLELVVSLSEIMRFAASQTDDPKVHQVADKLDAAGSTNHVRMTGRAIPKGVVYRIEVEEGVLKAVGNLASGGKAVAQPQ